MLVQNILKVKNLPKTTKSNFMEVSAAVEIYVQTLSQSNVHHKMEIHHLSVH